MIKGPQASSLPPLLLAKKNTPHSEKRAFFLLTYRLHIGEELKKLVLPGTSWWNLTWNGPIASKRIIPFLTDTVLFRTLSTADQLYSILVEYFQSKLSWTIAMAPKRKRVSEVYPFFKQREGYFICEIENDSGSSNGGKIAVNSEQVTQKSTLRVSVHVSFFAIYRLKE